MNLRKNLDTTRRLNPLVYFTLTFHSIYPIGYPQFGMEKEKNSRTCKNKSGNFVLTFL